MKTEARLFKLASHHLNPVLTLVERRWNDILVEANEDLGSPAAYLQWVIDNHEDIYVIGLSTEDLPPTLSALVWVERRYNEPIVYAHAVLGLDLSSIKSARMMLHALVDLLFKQNNTHAVLFSGITQNPIHKFFKRSRMGNYGELKNSEYHPVYGLVTYWEWSIARPEYATIDLKWLEVQDEGNGQEQGFQEAESGSASVGLHPVRKRRLQWWPIQLFKR